MGWQLFPLEEAVGGSGVVSDQCGLDLTLQVCQVHQVVHERFPPAPGRRGVSTGKMPRLPFLEISQLRVKVAQVP